ncbi:hypothetical protein OROHE_018496 [Orobanche hederae]
MSTFTVSSSLYRDSIAHMKPFFKKFHKFSKFLAAILMFGSIICFFIVMGSGFFYMYPYSETLVDEINQTRDTNTISNDCNVFSGKWVVDESYPLYNASQCPFVEPGFDCLANGRRDKEYLKWRWKPDNCEIPRFDARVVLELLRGKRVVFVGDSLSRTQWESMICMLMSGIEDKNSVYEINGSGITKQIRYLGVRFGTCGITVEFYRSIFLVQPGPVPKNSPKRVKTVLKLDRLDGASREWIDADILVFNSGHWWNPAKLFEMIGGRIKFGMPISSAFKVALATWQSWIDNAINPNRTQVFFRTFESSHWSSGSRQNCKVTRQPSLGTVAKERSSISEAIINAVKSASFPVKLLHVTPMGASRSDAHVGSWSDNPSVPDCSHWCLPGVPDMWNEFLIWFLLSSP